MRGGRVTLGEFMEALQDLADLIDSGCDDAYCHRYASRWDIADVKATRRGTRSREAIWTSADAADQLSLF